MRILFAVTTLIVSIWHRNKIAGASDPNSIICVPMTCESIWQWRKAASGCDQSRKFREHTTHLLMYVDAMRILFAVTTLIVPNWHRNEFAGASDPCFDDMRILLVVAAWSFQMPKWNCWCHQSNGNWSSCAVTNRCALNQSVWNHWKFPRLR